MRNTLFVMLVACGGSNGAQPDAKPKLDAPHLDAPHVDAPRMDATQPDAPSFDAATASGTHYHFVVDHENIPTTNMQALQYGLDLNNDGAVDNQLGEVFSALSAQGFDFQSAVTASVDTGATLVLLDVQTTDFTAATDTGVTTYEGANPSPAPCNGPSDTTCRHHLDGSGSFDVAASSPRDPVLIGEATAGTFTNGAGKLPFELAFGATSAPAKLELIGARVRLTGVSAAGVSSGILAGGIRQSDMTNAVYPAWQAGMMAAVYADCCGTASSPGGATCVAPACGCTDNSFGKTLLALFDTGTEDCVISESEISGNSLVQSLVAPDITIDGVPALSVGVGISAVGATFTP